MNNELNLTVNFKSLHKELLVKTIIDASEKYYKDGSSEWTDKEFDEMISRLKELDPNHPLLTITGWGYKPECGIKHPYGHIGGIDLKIKNLGLIPTYKYFYISAKFDGGSATIYYNNGYYQMALSRGDGNLGENISHAGLKKCPIKLDIELTGYVRCEAVISYENFKNFPTGRSIRNTAVGLLKSEYPNPEEFKYLEFIPVRIFDAKSNKFYSRESDEFKSICNQFPSGIAKFVNSSTGNPRLYISKPVMDNLSAGYPADGLVVETKDLSQCYAFKFDDEIHEVLVNKVEWNTQFTGKIFPLVWFNSISISGCTATKATGKSYEFIKTNKIGLGSLVKIVRSGEVIPNILGIVKPSDITQLPECSYGCDPKFIRIEGANAYCRNPECKSFINGLHYRLIMNHAPTGFSQEMLNQILENFNNSVINLLNNIKLMNSSGIIPLIGKTDHQKSLINNVLTKLSKLEIELETLMSICSVEGFGSTLSSVMESKFRNLPISEFQKYCMTHEELDPEFCPNSRARDSWKRRFEWIQIMLGYFNLKLSEFHYSLPRISNNLIKIKYPPRLLAPFINGISSDGKLIKNVVCITGKIDGMTKSEFAEKEIYPRDYEYTEDITKATILINAGDCESNKVKTARKLNIYVCSLNEYLIGSK